MRMPRVAAPLAVLLALLLVPAPGAQAAEISTLRALAAATAAGQGSAVEIGAWRELGVAVRVTAGSGTVTVFRVYLEGTFDGTNWFELPCLLVLKGGAAAPGALTLNQRDVVNEALAITSAKYAGVCRTPVSTVRAAWDVAGTTPSETFEVLVSGK